MIIDLIKNNTPTEPGVYVVKLAKAKKPYLTWLRATKGERTWNNELYSGLIDGTTPLLSDIYDDAQWSAKIEFRGTVGEEDF